MSFDDSERDTASKSKLGQNEYEREIPSLTLCGNGASKGVDKERKSEGMYDMSGKFVIVCAFSSTTKLCFCSTNIFSPCALSE